MSIGELHCPETGEYFVFCKGCEPCEEHGIHDHRCKGNQHE